MMQAMLPVISGRLRRLSTWPAAGLAFVAVVLCQAGFYWRQARLGDLEVLDTRQWYTPEQVVALFDALDRHDAGARAVYAWTEVSLDMAFLAAYGLLFAILLLRLFGNRVPVYLVPLALAFADALENITVAALAASYDGAPSPVSWVAAVFTLLKSALIVATLAATGAGVIRWLITRLRLS